MNVRSLQWADFLARTDEQKAPYVCPRVGVLTTLTPKTLLIPFYSNTGFYSGRTNIDFPEMQALIDEGNSLVETEERVPAYEQIAQLHYDLAPLIALPEQSPFQVVREEVQGLYRNPMRSGSYLFKDISK